MVTKNFSISVSEWVFNTYLNNIGNRSKFIEEMIIKGSEISTGEYETTKNQNLKLFKENRVYRDENIKLKRKIQLYKDKFDKRDPADYDPELIRKQKAVDSIISSGILADDEKEI